MSQAALVPKLRFSEFSDDWEEKRFVDITTKISDGIHSTPNYDEGGTYSFVNGNNLVNGVIKINSQTKKVDENEYTTHQRPLGSNTILISINGTIGNLALYNNEKVVLGKSACYLNINEKDTDKLYVFNLLRTCKIKRFFNSELTGSTIKNLSLTTIKNTKLNLPTKPEQQKIAAFLTAVDTKIEQLSKKQELLGEYKKGLMQQIFSQAIRFKADDGSTFPEWKEKKLGDIVRFENGKGHEQNISKDGKFIVVNSKFISSQGRVKKYTDTQKSPLNFGDVVMVMSDVPNGKALAKCYYIEQDNLYSLNQRICGLKHKLADTKFIYYRINRHKYFLSFDSGVGQTNLKKMEILNCPLNIPTDIKEQAKIANFLSSVDNKIEQMGKQLDESKQFKKALLQQMFV